MFKQVFFLALMFFSDNVWAQSNRVLKQKIEAAVLGKKAIVGVSIAGNDGKDTLSLNGNHRFPLQSVFKFHIALMVLDRVDHGKLSLDQKIQIQKKDLLPGLYSPLREQYPAGASLPVSRILEYMVCESDNVACDVLLKWVGGPSAVENYFRKKGFNNLAIKTNEEMQQADWDLQFQNFTTPKAATEVLMRFYYNQPSLLSKKSYDLIWQLMKKVSTGSNRLKAGLPQNSSLAHKTGSSGTNKEGLTAAVNDIGIVFLPGGRYFFISVFVTDSHESLATNEKIIADIANAASDFFNQKVK